MASWAEFAAQAPGLADRVGALFTRYRHHTMATLRLDGSPRMSGTEVNLEDGEFVLGMMTGTRRAADLRRDSRVAIHSHSVDPPSEKDGSWSGEAKVAGRALPIQAATPQGDEPEWFHIDISEVVFTRVGEPADHLLIESWRPDEGHRTLRR